MVGGDRAWRRPAEHQIIELFARFRPDVEPRDLVGFESNLAVDSQALQRMIDSSADEILPAIRSQYPVLCLSDSWNIPSMWAHYARSHTAVCLVFDAAEDPVIGGAFQVQYADDLPEIPFLGAPPAEFVTKSILTKHSHWCGESEYRAVAREQGEGVRDVEWNPTSQAGFVNLTPKALVGIILGAFFAPANIDVDRGRWLDRSNRACILNAPSTP